MSVQHPFSAPDNTFSFWDLKPSQESNGSIVNSGGSVDAIANGVSPSTYHAIATYLLVVVVLGITGNAAMIYTFARCKKLHNPINFLIINLSASDLLVAMAGTPLSTASAFQERWLFGNAGCNFYGFVNYYCGCISLNTLAMISLFRYTIIVKGGWKRMFSTKRDALYAALGIHIYTLVLTTPPLYGWNRFVLAGFRINCDIDFLTKTPLSISYIIYMFIFLFFVPLGVIVWSYWKIYQLLSRRNETVATSPRIQRFAERIASHSKSPRMSSLEVTAMIRWKGSQASRREKRMSNSARWKQHYPIFVLLVTIVVFLVAWLPYCVVSLWLMIGEPEDVPLVASTIPSLFAKSCVIYNPIIYAILNPRFRKCLMASFFFFTW